MSDPTAMRILLVDDDESKRYLISRTLRRAGYKIEEAVSGNQALRMALRGPTW